MLGGFGALFAAYSLEKAKRATGSGNEIEAMDVWILIGLAIRQYSSYR